MHRNIYSKVEGKTKVDVNLFHDSCGSFSAEFFWMKWSTLPVEIFLRTGLFKNFWVGIKSTNSIDAVDGNIWITLLFLFAPCWLDWLFHEILKFSNAYEYDCIDAFDCKIWLTIL